MVFWQNSQLQTFLVNLYEIFGIRVSSYEEHLRKFSLQKICTRKVIAFAYVCVNPHTAHLIE